MKREDFGFWMCDFGLRRKRACSLATPIQNPKSEIHNPSRSAFTLIEVLVAIALVLALVGTMYAFLFDMLSARRRVIEHVWTETAASALIKQLDADLHTCIVGDSIFGSGVQGDESRVRILSRGVAAHLASRGIDDPDVFGDLQLSEYRFDALRQRVEGRRGPASAAQSAQSPFSPIEGAVSRVRFRYHDGQQWQRAFDSRTSNRLPLAVEVAVWYGRESDDREDNEPTDAATRSIADTADADESNADEEQLTFDEPQAIDNDDQSLPPPDRIRIILIPDAGSSQLISDDGGAP